MPLHFTKYTGLIHTLGYGFGAYLLMATIFTPMLKFCLKHIPYKIALIIDCTLGIIIVLDNLYMIIHTLVTKTKPIYWSICFREVCG